jgi:hypothetical protein
MKKFFCEGEIIIPLSSYEKTLSSFEKTLSSFEKTLSFIFKGRSGSFIAFRDPWVLYTHTARTHELLFTNDKILRLERLK